MKLHVHFSRGLLGSLTAIGAALLIFFTWALAVQPKPPVSGTVSVTVLTPEQKVISQRYSQVRAGMTKKQVKKIMGIPDSTQYVPLFNSGTGYETWYWNNFPVQFDDSGHVLGGISPYPY